MFRVGLLSIVALVVSGCHELVPMQDGGTDASFDGGADAGSRDAGRDAYRPPVDAGPQWTEGDPPDVGWILPDCVVAHGVLAREVQTTSDNGYADLNGFDVRDGRATMVSRTRSGRVWQTVSPTEVVDEILPDGRYSPSAVVIHDGTARMLALVRRPDLTNEEVISTVEADPRGLVSVAGGNFNFYAYGARIESAGAHIDVVGEMNGPSVPSGTVVGWLMIDGDGAQVGSVRQITSPGATDPTVLFDAALRRGVVIDEIPVGADNVFVTPFTETAVGARRAIVDMETKGQSAPVGVIAGDVVAIVYHGEIHPDAFYPLEYYTEVSVTTGEVLVPPRRWYEHDRGPHPVLHFVARADGRVDVLRQPYYPAIDYGVFNASQPLTVELGRSRPIEVPESDGASLHLGGGGYAGAVLAERDGEDLFVFWHEVGPCMAGEFEDEVDRPCVSSALWAILRCDE